MNAFIYCRISLLVCSLRTFCYIRTFLRSGKWYAEADLVHVPYRVSVCWIAFCFFFLVARVSITEHIGLAFYRYQYLLSVCLLFPPLRLHRWWIGVHYRAWNGGAIYERLSFMGELLPLFFYDPRISRYLQMSLKTAVTRGSFFFMSCSVGYVFDVFLSNNVSVISNWMWFC